MNMEMKLMLMMTCYSAGPCLSCIYMICGDNTELYAFAVDTLLKRNQGFIMRVTMMVI